MPPQISPDTPALQRHLLWGSLQLLGWLVCYPSAWCQYVAGLDVRLRPDFPLPALRPAQWRRPEVQRFLLIGYIVWPLLMGTLTGLLLLGWGVAGIDLVSGMAASVMVLVTGAIVGSIVASVAAGLATTLVGSVVGGMLSASSGYDALAFGILCGLGFGIMGGGGGQRDQPLRTPTGTGWRHTPGRR